MRRKDDWNLIPLRVTNVKSVGKSEYYFDIVVKVMSEGSLTLSSSGEGST